MSATSLLLGSSKCVSTYNHTSENAIQRLGEIKDNLKELKLHISLTLPHFAGTQINRDKLNNYLTKTIPEALASVKQLQKIHVFYAKDHLRVEEMCSLEKSMHTAASCAMGTAMFISST